MTRHSRRLAWNQVNTLMTLASWPLQSYCQRCYLACSRHRLPMRIFACVRMNSVRGPWHYHRTKETKPYSIPHKARLMRRYALRSSVNTHTTCKTLSKINSTITFEQIALERLTVTSKAEKAKKQVHCKMLPIHRHPELVRAWLVQVTIGWMVIIPRPEQFNKNARRDQAHNDDWIRPFIRMFWLVLVESR